MKRCLMLIFACLILSCKSKKVTISNDSEIENIEVAVSFDITDDLESSMIDFHNKLIHISNDHQDIKVYISSNLDELSKDKAKAIKDNRQGYYIKTINGRLTIYAVHALGAQYAMYGYLEKLGYKWYFPGDLWEITPSVRSWYISVDEVGRPDYRGRRFFGGGGYPRNHVADPDNYVMNSWETWQRRNRFGADYFSKGHAWQDFIRRNKAIIDQNPDFVSESGKQLCVTNKGLQQLFVADRIKKIEENRKRYGAQDPRALTIAAEPNDGGNHCNCTECNKLGSISNRVFYLANITAREIKKKYSQIKVSMMAYNEHAAPPDFDLEKNIHVSVVPYAYQDVDAPEELIRLWKRKHHDIQVRDYWGVVIWTRGYPVKNFMNLAQDRTKVWSKLGVNQMMVESSYSIGMAGVPLYLMSKIGWDKDLDTKQTLDVMFTDLFGAKSGQVMQTMLQRWSDTGLIIEFEQYTTIEDIARAKKWAKSQVHRDRIDAFHDYFNFLLLQEKVKSTKADSKERRDEIASLLDYSYSIMDGLMLHSYWMPSPISRLYDRKNYKASDVRKSEKARGTQYYVALKKENFLERIETKKEDPFSKVSDTETIETRNKKESIEIPNKEREIKTSKSFVFRHTASGPSTYPYDIEVTKRSKSIQKNATIVSLYDSDGYIVSSKRYIPGRKYTNEFIRIPGPGKYEIRFRSSNVTAQINWKKSQGIELVPGTLVDFGEYYIHTTSKHLVFKKDKTILKYLNASNLKYIEYEALIYISVVPRELLKIEANNVMSADQSNVTIYL